MLSLFIRYFSIIFCGILTNLKISNHKSININLSVLSAIFTLPIACIISFFYNTDSLFRIMLAIFLSMIIVSIYTKNSMYTSLLFTFISFGISFIFYIFANIFISLILVAWYRESSAVPYDYADFPLFLLHLLLITNFINRPRIQRGILTLINTHKVHLLSMVSITFLLYSAIINNHKGQHAQNIRHLINYCYCFLAIFLLYWWHRRIKQYYIERLREVEITSYRNDIAERDKKIKLLEDNNAYLGELLHKYRKIIPIMELAVADIYQSDETFSAEIMRAKGESLQNQLLVLKAESNEIMKRYQKDVVVKPQLNLLTIDAMLSLNEKNAKQNGIYFETIIDEDLKDLVSKSIEEPDLLHLLTDLIENAFNAMKTCKRKAIMIHFGRFYDDLLIEIADSGKEFDIETYQHFGNEKYTSHKEDGGSGTGLIHIWEKKKKYKASLLIYEYPPGSKVYSKKISFVFDRKKAFLLQSYRYKEIQNNVIRGDLHVFPYESK